MLRVPCGCPSGTARSTGVPSLSLARRNAVFGPDQLQLPFDVDELDGPSVLTALEAGRRPSSIEPLRRLGESDEFAELFLQLLERNGWDVANPVAFAGGGVFLVADCGRFEARGQGDTLGAAVANLLHEVCTYYGVRQARPAA